MTGFLVVELKLFHNVVLRTLLYGTLSNCGKEKEVGVKSDMEGEIRKEGLNENTHVSAHVTRSLLKDTVPPYGIYLFLIKKDS